MKKKSLMKKIFVIICIIIIILAIIITTLIKNNKLQQLIIKPVIYYIHDDEIKMPLLVNSKTFSNNTKVIWSKSCTGVIKKDGQEISRENGITITQEGIYEITVTSIISRQTVTRTLNIDKTPPNVEISKNPDESYTITFEDVNDIGVAKLTKYNLETMQVVSELDLKEGGLQKSIKITEKGYYNLKIEDYYGNIYNKITDFNIK